MPLHRGPVSPCCVVQRPQRPESLLGIADGLQPRDDGVEHREVMIEGFAWTRCGKAAQPSDKTGVAGAQDDGVIRKKRTQQDLQRGALVPATSGCIGIPGVVVAVGADALALIPAAANGCRACGHRR